MRESLFVQLISSVNRFRDHGTAATRAYALSAREQGHRGYRPVLAEAIGLGLFGQPGEA
jgi:hypothetical protein